MFNTTPPDSPRAQVNHDSDISVASSSEEARAPASGAAPLPSMATRSAASAHGEGSAGGTTSGLQPEAEPEHSDPLTRVRTGEGGAASGEARGSDEKRSDEKTGEKKTADQKTADQNSPSGGEAGSTGAALPSRAPHKQLLRHERVLNLKEKQLHLKFDKFLQEEEGEFDVDIRTAKEMEALISWLEGGPPVKVFRLTCDFGGMHLTLSEDSDECEAKTGHAKPERLDAQLFECMLAACHGIEALDLSDCRLAPENYRMLRHFLMNKRCKLDSLLLGGQLLREKEAANLARGLEHNRSLTLLSLSGTAMLSSGLKRILEAVIRNPRIDSLWLENVNSCEEQLPVLRLLLVAEHCTFLGLQNPTGVRIVGRDLRLWNERFEQFCNQLSVCTSLRLLDLSAFDLTEANFKSLVDALKFNKDLEWLELGINKPSSKQTQLIRSFLVRNRRVHREAMWPHATAALDLLVGTVMADTWPKELSDVMVSGMENATLEQLKKGLDTGFPMARRKRKGQTSSASSSSTASASASGSRQRTPTSTAAPAVGERNTTDAPAPGKRGE